jgi:hypothetical protein
VRYRVPRNGVRSIKEFVVLAVWGELPSMIFGHSGTSACALVMQAPGDPWPQRSRQEHLLHVIAGALNPTTVTAIVRGHVAPLLQFGTGFDPGLSSREDVT